MNQKQRAGRRRVWFGDAWVNESVVEIYRDDVARFPDMLRQAFRTATSGTPGPVHLQFAGNEGQIDADTADMALVFETEHATVPAFRPAHGGCRQGESSPC